MGNGRLFRDSAGSRFATRGTSPEPCPPGRFLPRRRSALGAPWRCPPSAGPSRRLSKGRSHSSTKHSIFSPCLVGLSETSLAFDPTLDLGDRRVLAAERLG